MAEPYEIMAEPFDCFLAPAGTAKPSIATDPPGGAWTLLGKRGADEYDEGGVTVAHEQSINEYRGLRGTGPIKVFRTSEGLKISFVLNDLTVEAYAKIINDAAVDSTGARSFRLHRGATVATHALLLRSENGPYGDGLPAQYWVPVVYAGGSPSVVHKKGTAAGLAVEFTAIEWLDAADEDLRFGEYEAQDTDGS